MDDNLAKKHVASLFEESITVKRATLESCLGAVVDGAKICADSIANGGKLLFCGNGGSAADAQHLAAELLVRLRPQVNRSPLPAIALALDSSAFTACGNDYSFETYFERMVQALGRPGDVLIGISTSGKSANVINALKHARSSKIKTIGFLGAEGGPAKACCDLPIIVPSKVTGRIQESHITIGHAMLELVEEFLLKRGVIAAAR